MDNFAKKLFNKTEMKKRLTSEEFDALMLTIETGAPLSDKTASALANALKDWALENGATHYCHWFQPMTGTTAEKHDSFVSPNQEGDLNIKFRVKELIKGEPDASSFPSGGIRCTFEARGYTAYDPTSYAFIKDNTLCLPTAFFSYQGDVLDKKTPLLRSVQALNKQAMRVLKLFNSTASFVKPSVGAEQEYFLIDKEVYKKRRDLIYTGRTLVGTSPPKGQQLDDHYFGTIKPRVLAFMKDLDNELLEVGIIPKTEHNETAPAQHELAPSYSNVNIACDQNQLTMELMKKVANRHNMHCLLHEKPFSGINGSGKHNNWSLLTDTDENLLETGDDPQTNAQFLLFLCAIIKAIDEYQDLLRVSVASAGNDFRLGADEAPPAIMSIFIGSELNDVVESIVEGKVATDSKHGTINIGVDCLPKLPKDATDRNRTSPFAFTGNKFEFRSVGSCQSIADPNTVLNTIVAESLCQFADVLENVADFNVALKNLIVETLKKHKRILFDGDGYSQDWVAEAEQRGLLNLRSTADALPYLTAEKNVALFTKHNIFNKRELVSRQEILLLNYCDTIKIEGLTLIEIVEREVVPSIVCYLNKLAKLAKDKQTLQLDNSSEKQLIDKLSNYIKQMTENAEKLSKFLKDANNLSSQEKAKFYHDFILCTMEEIRKFVDKAEKLTPANMWAMPSIGDILYSVN